MFLLQFCMMRCCARAGMGMGSRVYCWSHIAGWFSQLWQHCTASITIDALHLVSARALYDQLPLSHIAA